MPSEKNLLFYFFCFSILCTNLIFSQRNIVRIDGTVFEEKNKLDKVSITVYENEQFVTKFLTESNGKFRFQLNYDSDYILEFSKPGYISKKFNVNTKGISMEDQDFGHEYGGWNVSLIKAFEGMDLLLFDKPFAKIYYNDEKRKFVHDVEYTEFVKKEFAQLQKDFEKKKKEETKRKKEEEKKKQQSAEAIGGQQKAGNQQSIVGSNEKAKKEESKNLNKPNNFNENIFDNSANKLRRDTGTYKNKEEFLQALAKLYPQGITEEIYMDGNVKVTRRIVVEGNSGNEYKFTEHPWGGKFWFKNGTPVNESVWNSETTMKK